MSIRLKLITILICVGLIPTLVAGSVTYVDVSRQLQNNTSNQLTSIASKQAEKINGLLQAKLVTASTLASSYGLSVALEQYGASASTANLGNISSIIDSAQVASPDVQTISVASSKGAIFASTLAGSTGTSLNSEAILANGTLQSINIIKDPSDDLDELSISLLVRQSTILNVVFRVDDVVAAIQDYTGLGNTGETIVVNKDTGGNAISLFPLRFNTSAALTTNLNSLHLYDSHSGVYNNVTDYRNQKVLVDAMPLGFSNWILATKIDESEVTAPIVSMRNSLIIIVVLSLLIIAVIAWYLAQYFTKPISSLAYTAQLIGQGDFSAHSDVKSHDEIGALGKSINSMGLSLNTMVSRIESQRNRLQLILDSTTDSIFAIDQTGKIFIANRAASSLTTLGIGSLVGKEIKDVLPLTKDKQPFEIDYNAPTARSYLDLRYISPDKITHYVKVLVGRIGTQQNPAEAQTIITVYDETKSRELEDMKVDFVSMAAHELRTPLAAVRGYLELLLRFNHKSPAVAFNKENTSYLEQAHKSATELGSLINSLLDVTRIEKGTLTLKMGRVDLAECILQAVKDSQFSAREKQIALSYDGPSEPCFITGDAVAIGEVINNFLSNAIKFTPVAGIIKVSLKQQLSDYVVSVQDSGIGIPKAALSSLFTKFYRVNGGLASGSPGTGLGLFISKAIVERHGGSVSVSSEENVGSIFTFTVPAMGHNKNI